MMPIQIDAQERDKVEDLHSALAEGLDDQLRELYLKYKRINSRMDRYLELLMQYGAKKLLLIKVPEMRLLARKVDEFLPDSNFYRKRKNASPLERLFKVVNAELRNIFNYDGFSRSDGAWTLSEWAKRLSKVVRVCPYCNAETVYAYEMRSRTKRGGKFKIHKSSFDHFYPQARYPFLGLSLYNLIPACTRCNSGSKSDSYEDLDKMVHPYESTDENGTSLGIHQNMKFRILPRSIKAFSFCNSEDIAEVLLTERKLNGFPKGLVWEKTFCLNDAYSQIYLEDAADAMLKAVRLPQSYLELLRRQLDAAKLPSDRLERIVYGAPLDEKMINVSRLGKLIIDTVETFQ